MPYGDVNLKDSLDIKMKRARLFIIAGMELFAIFSILILVFVAHLSGRELLIQCLLIVGFCTLIGVFAGWFATKFFLEPILRSRQGELGIASPREGGILAVEYKVCKDDILSYYLYKYE